MEMLRTQWPILLVIAWFAYKWWSANKVVKMLPALRERGAVFIDVRSQSEYNSASAPNTKNIPVGDIGNRLKEIPTDKPIVVCCASGTRSGMARMTLLKNGYKEVYNVGPWTKLLKK